MEILGISEGDKVKVKIQGNKLILEFIPDPLALALKLKNRQKRRLKNSKKNLKASKRVSIMIRVLLDSTYLLLTFRISVEGLTEKHLIKLRQPRLKKMWNIIVLVSFGSNY